MHRKLIFILLILALLVSACGGGGDKKDEEKPADKATATPAPQPTQAQEPTATAEPQGPTPQELGQEIGAVYVEALVSVIDLVKDQPPVDQVKPQVEELKETYVQKLVELGWQREALSESERSQVDAQISLALDAFYRNDPDRWTAYSEAQTFYAKEDFDFNQLLVSFNIIGQYASFDLLKKQEPEEAVRLGIMEASEAEAPAAAATEAPAPTATTPPEPTEPPAAEPTSAPATELGEEIRSQAGGFAFRPISGYQVEEEFGLVGMDAPDADPDIGPSILIMGYPGEEASLEELLGTITQDPAVGVEFSEPQEITVGDAPGLVVEVSGSDEEGRALAGRVVVAMPDPAQKFVMMGVAPPERWQGELEPLFEAVLASISFFPPSSGEEEPGVGGALTHQWAISATASSEYDNPDWSASQAIGEPDTFECEDLATAWAAADYDTLEWLELLYDTPVLPTEINVYQTYSPDQVTRVEVIDLAGEYHEVYAADPVNRWDECPYVLSISVEVDFQVMGVRLTIDQTILDISYNEIDAVELVGHADRPGMAEPEP